MMRDTPAVLPRLDIQSDDEEEFGGKVHPQQDSINHESTTVKWSSFIPTFHLPSLPKEAKTVITTSIVLLILLVIINKIVETLNNDKNMSEAVIMVLAYALTPVRFTVESIRFLAGSVAGPPRTQFVKNSIDYDMIVDNIVNSDKFKTMIEQISTEKVVSFGAEMEARLKTEIENRSSLDNEIVKIEQDLSETKLHIKNVIDKAVEQMKTDLSDSNSVNEQKDKLTALDQQINALKVQIDDLAIKASQDIKNENDKTLAEVEAIKEKLRLLKEDKAVTESEIQKCCSNNVDMNLVIENKVSQLLPTIRQSIENDFVTEEELNLRLMNVASDNKDKIVSYTSAAIEETKTQIEQRVNAKIEEVRTNGDMFANLEKKEDVVADNVTFNRDIIRDHVDVARIVRDALTKYDADKTGLFDFALETAGGSIVTTKCTEPYQMTSAVMSVWGIPFWWDNNSPRTILQPGTSPGECWAFRGSHGVVVVQLSASIHITAVTIEHISNLLSPDGNIYSAPSQMTLSGVGPDPEILTPLLNFTYSATGDPVQTFRVPAAGSQDSWRVVELAIHNNHGHPDYTCLYRLRVHGNVNSDTDDKKH